MVASWDHSVVQRAEALFAHFGIGVASLSEPGLPEPSVSSRSPRDTATTKAGIVASLTDLPAFREERHFSIDELDGRFGPDLPLRSFPEEITAAHVTQVYDHLIENEWLKSGLPRPREGFEGFFDMIDEVLRNMGCFGPDDREASLTSSISLVWPDYEHLVVEARLEGQLARAPGQNNESGIESYFAPTNHFVPSGDVPTLAEMEPEARRAILPSAQVYEAMSHLFKV